MENVVTMELLSSLWQWGLMTAVSLFGLLFIKDLVGRVFLYIQIRISGLSYRATVLYKGKEYIIDDIRLTSIKLKCKEDIVYIPLETWAKNEKVVPNEEVKY